ncbi:hypothetical protein V8E54_013573 [Elaphomyces granulatus]
MTSTPIPNPVNLVPRSSGLQTWSQPPTTKEKEQSSHSSISTRKRAIPKKPPLQSKKRPRLESGSSTPDEDKSIARLFSRTPSKRTVKTTTAFIEAQSVLRKTLPPPNLSLNSRSRSDLKNGRAKGSQDNGWSGPDRYKSTGNGNPAPSVECASVD